MLYILQLHNPQMSVCTGPGADFAHSFPSGVLFSFSTDSKPKPAKDKQQHQDREEFPVSLDWKFQTRTRIAFGSLSQAASGTPHMMIFTPTCWILCWINVFCKWISSWFSLGWICFPRVCIFQVSYRNFTWISTPELLWAELVFPFLAPFFQNN